MGFDAKRDLVGNWGFDNPGQFVGSIFDPLGIFGSKTIAGTKGVSAIMGGTPKQIDPNAPGGSLDTSEADMERQRLQGLMGQLQQQAATGDGAWQDSLKQAISGAQANASAVGQSKANTGGNAQSALMDIGNAQSSAAQRGVRQGDILRTEAKQSAQDQLAQLEPAMGAGDISQAATQAAVQQQTREANLALQQQAQNNKNSLLNAGTSMLGAFLSDGGAVPGVPQVFGDDSRNDTVPAMLSPGEIVVPRSAAGDPKKAADFARAVAERGGAEHHDSGGLADAPAPDAGTSAAMALAPHIGNQLYYGQLNEPQDASIENGGLLNTAPYAALRGDMDTLGGQLGERAMGGNSIADTVAKQQQDENIQQAMAAKSQADAIKGAAIEGAKSAGEAGKRRLEDQSKGQRSVGNLLQQRRAQEQALAQAQQQAAFQNTAMNAGLTLQNQAALRGMVSGAGQGAMAAISAMKGAGGGGGGTPGDTPTGGMYDQPLGPEYNPTGDGMTGESGMGDFPEPSADVQSAAHGGLIFDDSDDDERNRVRSFLQLLRRAA